MRAFLLIALLLFPSFGGAQDDAPGFDGWSYEHLQGDTRLSELLGRDVQSGDARPLGRLDDIIFNDKGSIQAAVVQFEEGIGNSGVAIAIIDWAAAVFPAAGDALIVNVGSNGDQDEDFDASGTRAGDVVGRRVVFSDDPQFGRVEDLLIDVGGDEVSALLIDAGDTRYALPVRDARIPHRRDFIRYAIGSSEATALGAFEESRSSTE